MTRSFAPVFLVALACCAVPACSWDGHFSVLGYSTKPNYDTRFKTVRVPICKTRTRWTVTPAPGLEMDLQRAIVREIQTKTPYRIAQQDADTELLCTIVSFQKNLLSSTQFNTIREAETILTVELVWRDVRTGEILSKAARRPGAPGEPDLRQPLLATADSLMPPGSKPPAVTGAAPTAPLPGPVEADDEDAILDPVTKKKIVPIVVRSTANFRPELGESITTAMQRNIDRVAVQIVSAMETGW